jgi:hypothetical protein
MTALATSSYKTFTPSLGVPVRMTVYPPRFKLAYDLTEYVPELAPHGLLKLQGDEFTRRYREQLDRLDIDQLRAKFAAIQQRHDGKRPVLLCFEDVHAGEHCHRRDFADYWQERTGQRVPEVGGKSVNVGSHPVYDHVVRPI